MGGGGCGVGACGDDPPLHAQTDDASTVTTTARATAPAMTREPARTHREAVNGFRPAVRVTTHSRNAIRMLNLECLAEAPAAPTTPTPAITNRADDPKARQYYRKNSPRHERARPIPARSSPMPNHARGNLRTATPCMSSLWMTELSA
jgi:hypothetical protein